QAEVGPKLKFVLYIRPGLTSTVVAVGVALKKLGGGEVIVGGNESLNKLREIRRRNNPLVRPLIAGIELGVGIAAAECNSVLAMIPDGICGRHNAVLKHSGKSALGSGALTDGQKLQIDDAAGIRGAK